MSKLEQLQPLMVKHVDNILCWAKDTFQEKFEPSFQQIEILMWWSHLLNAKRKVHWNQVHPENIIELTPEEDLVKKKIGMSLQSGHGLAKTATLSIIGLHFLQCLKDSRIIVTAPAGPQLFTVIWPELYKWINVNDLTRSFWKWSSKTIYPMNQATSGDHWIRPRTIDPKATAEEQGEALAGLHGLYTLRILDESSGIPDPVMLPFEGGLTDPVALIVMGFNPTRNVGFAIETQRKYRERWMCFHLDGEELAESPPSWYNPELQKDLLQTYGRESNFYRVRVRGLPPIAAPDTLFPWDWVMDAAERELEPMDYDPIVLGVDIGGQGTDRSIATIRHRDTILAIRERRGLDTMQVAWWIETIIAEIIVDYPQSRLLTGIDSIGIGKGVYDYLKTVKQYRDIFAINVATKLPSSDRFFTYRDRNYWWLREAFEAGEIDIPKDDGLIAELTAFRWSEENLEGKIKVEDKPSMRKRLPEGIRSPDKADSLMLTQHIIRVFGKRQVISAHEDRRQRMHARMQERGSWKTV